MKAALLKLVWLSMVAGALAADGTAVAPLTPQPRARLVQTATGSTRQADADATPESHPIVVMSKFVVRDSPVPVTVPRPVPREPETFSLLNGGRWFTTKLGALPLEVGMWTPRDIMPETAKFTAQKTRADFDFLRIKF